MELYVYDESFRLLGVIDRFASLRWRRKYYEPGEFELHLENSEDTRALFDALLCGKIGRNVLLHRPERPECGIAHSVVMKERDLAISGRMLSYEFRYCAALGKYDFQNANAEQAMHRLARDAAVRGALSPWSLKDGVSCGNAETITKQISNKELLKVLTEISKAAHIGYRLRFDPLEKSYCFDTYQGTDRSVEQTANGRVIFGDTFDNLKNPEFTQDDTGFYDYAIVLGEERPSGERVSVTVDRSDVALRRRRELLVDARDLQKGEGVTESEYLELLRQRGKDKLWNCRASEALESDVLAMGNFRYLQDWNLGDVVTLDKNSWGRSWSQIRITEVEEIYEGDTERIIPVFGNPLPEFFGIGSD